MNNIEFLRRITLFKNIDDETLEAIAKFIKEKEYKAGEIVFREKDEAANFYIIKEGEIKITKKSYSGKEEMLAILSPYEFFGEMAILDEDTRCATAEAITDSKLLIVDRVAIEEIIKNNPAPLLEIALTQIRRLRNADEKISRMERIEEMYKRILDAQENERKRIARDIHDGPCQRATSLTLLTDVIRKYIEKGNTEKAVKELNNLKTAAATMVKEIRDLIFDLRPPTLDAEGLVLALKGYLDKFSKEENIGIKFNYDKEQRYDKNIEYSIFAVIQEALNNIKKHAKAKSVLVNITHPDENKLVVQVIDDGVGFNLKEVENKYEEKKKLGLLGMRERAELINAKFTILTEINKGTKVIIEVPLK